MQSIDQIRDPVARARAQMSAEILQIRLHLSEAEDAEEIAELEADLDRFLASLRAHDPARIG